MRTLLLAFPLSLLVACSNLPGDPGFFGGASSGAGTGVSASSGSVGSGEAIYASYCASCHGANAQGGSAPALAGIPDSAGVVDFILNGGGGMPAFGSTLSDQDVSDVLAYLGSLGGSGGSGQALYVANCARCHGTNAQGGSAPALAGISDSAGVIDVILYGEDGMPGFADRLTDAEIADILSYLGGLSGSGGGGGDEEGEEGED